MLIEKNDLELYFNDILELNPSSAYYLGFKNEKTLSRVENVYDCNYQKKYNNILCKYKNTKNKLLKIILKINKDLNKYPYGSYIPIDTFNNIVVNFDNINKNLYPKNSKYFEMRQNDFKEFIQDSINVMYRGIKKKIVLPKIICKKLISQIKKTEYDNLYNFLKNIYYKKCRNTIGLCNIKNGKKIYKLLIKYHCGGFYMSPEKIHKYGLELVKKFKKDLVHDQFNTPEELYSECKKIYEDIYDNILKKYFYHIPIKKCIIKPVPKDLEESNGMAYFDSVKGIFFINLSKYKFINKNSLRTLVFHETDPGHHYQFEYFNHKNMPLYKKYAFHNNALVEGWGLYTERLDGMNDGVEEYYQLRTVRLVVDTGINYYGWSYEKAFKYMKENLISIREDEIKEEIERYICIPAQAISYVIGMKNILHLRDLYINKYKLGDIKDFHKFILEDGVVSFQFLIDKMKK